MKNALVTTCLTTLLSIPILCAETAQKDPLVNGAPKTGSAQPVGYSPNLSIRYETFSLGLSEAAALQRENLGDSQLYAKILALLEKREAKQESLMVVRTQSGEKVISESILERIYPTEFESPRLPEALGVSIVPRKKSNEEAEPAEKEKEAVKAPPTSPVTSGLDNAPSLSTFTGLATPALPTAYETRNTGDTFEAEPILTDDNRTISLRIVPERVTFVGTTSHGQGIARCEMPEFESQRLNTNIVVEPGKTHLLGTMNRSPVSKVDADSSNRIWFAFVTADLAKP